MLSISSMRDLLNGRRRKDEWKKPSAFSNKNPPIFLSAITKVNPTTDMLNEYEGLKGKFTLKILGNDEVKLITTHEAAYKSAGKVRM